MDDAVAAHTERGRTKTAAGARAAELTVVIPTFNERDNVAPLVGLLDAALDGIAWEAIFVDDDSPDGTADAVRALARGDTRVRCVQRIGRRGLSTACIEGVLASSAPYVAVMDADLQHDERLLPRMLAALRDDSCDLVVGSRYVAGGSSAGLSSANRERFSAIGTTLARLVTRVEIADPMSGFFMLRRSVFDGAVRRLSAQGFKILLDILASSDSPPRIRELPFVFRERLHGESKLDVMVAWEFAMLLADKTVGHVVPVRFALFGLIGASGVIVHMAALWAALRLGAAFTAAQTAATMVAMTANFFLNNLFTYADRRLKGWRILRGLVSFYAICGLGAVANIGIASYLFARQEIWWLAGIAGILVGSVWNYAVSSVVTWKAR